MNRNDVKTAGATLEIDDVKRDVSAELAAFLSAKSVAASQLVAAVEKDSKLNACNAGSAKACDELPDKTHDRTDLVARFLPHGNVGGFRRDLLYTGQSFEVMQKVGGGYFFSANRAYFRDGSYGLAYLKTNAEIPPGRGFCAWFFYTGEHEYVANDGFKRRIPAFRIYSGETPTENPYCRSRVVEK